VGKSTLSGGIPHLADEGWAKWLHYIPVLSPGQENKINAEINTKRPSTKNVRIKSRKIDPLPFVSNGTGH